MVNPDKLALLERWTGHEALDAHARLHRTLPPFKLELRSGNSEREDYATEPGDPNGFTYATSKYGFLR